VKREAEEEWGEGAGDDDGRGMISLSAADFALAIVLATAIVGALVVWLGR
jgi:hypothetical protein